MISPETSANSEGAVAGVVGIESGVVSGVFNLESSGLSITVVIFCWRNCLISESMGHHDSEIMDDGGID